MNPRNDAWACGKNWENQPVFWLIAILYHEKFHPSMAFPIGFQERQISRIEEANAKTSGIGTTGDD